LAQVLPSGYWEHLLE